MNRRRGIRSFVHSFIHSFIHSFCYSVILSFIRSFIRSFIHSFIHSFFSRFPRPMSVGHPLTVYTAARPLSCHRTIFLLVFHEVHELNHLEAFLASPSSLVFRLSSCRCARIATDSSAASSICCANTCKIWQVTYFPRPPTLRHPTKVVVWGGVPDMVNHAKFHQNRFRGFGSPRGRSLPFSYA